MINGGIYQRGETVTFLIGVSDEDKALVTQLPTAAVKPKEAGQKTVPPESVVAVAQMTVTAVDANGSLPGGWVIFLPAATSYLLAEGQYVTDVRFVAANGIVKTDPIIFELVTAATLP